MASKKVVELYELVLIGPGMEKEFKFTIPINRRHLLLICLLLENGINPLKERSEELAALLSTETAAELAAFIPEMLKKGGPGLSEFYEKLKLL